MGLTLPNASLDWFPGINFLTWAKWNKNEKVTQRTKMKRIHEMLRTIQEKEMIGSFFHSENIRETWA